jgi:hypothetical protein
VLARERDSVRWGIAAAFHLDIVHFDRHVHAHFVHRPYWQGAQ